MKITVPGGSPTPLCFDGKVVQAFTAEAQWSFTDARFVMVEGRRFLTGEVLPVEENDAWAYADVLVAWDGVSSIIVYDSIEELKKRRELAEIVHSRHCHSSEMG